MQVLLLKAKCLVCLHGYTGDVGTPFEIVCGWGGGGGKGYINRGKGWGGGLLDTFRMK